MTPEKICKILEKKFDDAVVAVAADASHPHVTVAADRLVAVAEFLRDDSDLRFNLLRCITGLDLLEDNKLAAVYVEGSLSPSLFCMSTNISI